MEFELDSEKNNVKIQTENLRNVKKEFEFLNKKCRTFQKENETLFQKLANQSLNNQDSDEIIKNLVNFWLLKSLILIIILNFFIIKNLEISSLETQINEKSNEIIKLRKNEEKMLEVLNNKNLELNNLEEKKYAGMKPIKPKIPEELKSLVEMNNKKDILIAKILEIYKNDNEILQIIEEIFAKEENLHTKNFNINSLKLKEYEEELLKEKILNNQLNYEIKRLKEEYEKLFETKFPNVEDYKEHLVSVAVKKKKIKMKKKEIWFWKIYKIEFIRF